MFSPPPPSREERARFFSRVLLVRPLQPPLQTPQSDGGEWVEWVRGEGWRDVHVL